MDKGWLRRAIEDWFENNAIAEWLRGWNERTQERNAEVQQIAETATRKWTLLSPPAAISYVIMGLIYQLTGAEFARRSLENSVGGEDAADPSTEVAELLTQVFSRPEFREFSEITGAVITEPILSIFEQYAGDDQTDPKEFARAFHGFMGGLTGAAGIADTVIETLSGGQVEGAGRMLNSMYWSLGLGFLGWQTLAPLLEHGLQPGLERYYLRLYRPQRFGAGDLRDLYALGEISLDEFAEQGRTLGWRDQDLEKWMKLAFRTLPASDIFTLYQEGHITKEEATSRLRALGYDPGDLPLLFLLNPKDDAKEARAVTVSTTKAAYKERLISEDEFRANLAELNYSPREIELQLALLQQQVEQESKALTTAQIENAWEENILTDTEALHWLQLNGFGETEAGLLLSTWKAEAAPTFRKLNKGTITSAYVQGVLDRSQAKLKLEAVGFAPEDATLELDLAEARNPAAFSGPTGGLRRQLSPGTLARLLESRLIDAETMNAKLIEAGYSEADAELQTQLAMQNAAERARPLTQGVIQEAYVTGVINRQEAFSRLEALELTAEDAEIFLQTVELSHPAVFAPETVQSVRVPSVGALTEALWAGILDEQEFYARMAELGYGREGADIYKALAFTTDPVKTKTLTPAEIVDAYGEEFIGFGEAMQRLIEQGYTNQDALLKLRLRTNVIKDMEPWQNMLAGLIAPEAAFDQLFGMGFTPEEIETALSELEASDD